MCVLGRKGGVLSLWPFVFDQYINAPKTEALPVGDIDIMPLQALRRDQFFGKIGVGKIGVGRDGIGKAGVGAIRQDL